MKKVFLFLSFAVSLFAVTYTPIKVTTTIGSGDERAYDAVVQSDGKIVAVGNSNDGTSFNFAVVRYNTDLSLDTSFGTDGKVTTDVSGSNNNDYAHAVALQSDGKILVSGSNGSDIAVVRYNSDGTLDTTFDSDGKVVTSLGTSAEETAYGIAIQSDGKIVVGATCRNGTLDFGVVRYTSLGALDTSFSDDGKDCRDIESGDDAVNGIAIDGNGKIVLMGLSTYGGSNKHFAILRYNSDGTMDTSFDSDGKVTTTVGGTSVSRAYGLAIHSDNNISVVGYTSDNTADFAIAHYSGADGSLNSSFSGDGKLTTNLGSGDYGNDIILQSDGKIVFAGGSNSDFAVAKYNRDGSLDTDFDTDGKITTDFSAGYDFIESVVLDNSNNIVAIGFTHNGSNYDFALVRYTVLSINVGDKSYTENSAVSAFDTSATASALNDTYWDTGAKLEVQITSNNETSDEIAILTTGNFSINSGELTYSGTKVADISESSGTVNDGNVSSGNKLIINFTSNMTNAIIQELTRVISYRSTSENPAGTNATRTVTFTITNKDGDSNSDTSTITITDVNDAPIITSDSGGGSAAISIAENTTAVTTLTASDVESHTITYSIVGGADQSKFSVNSSSGVLTFSSAPDFENPTDSGTNNIYVVDINATDNGTPNKSDTQSITVTVTDVIEISFTNNGGGTSVTITPNENQTELTTITTSNLTGTINYTLGGADAGSFSVDSNGVVTFDSSPDYENKSSYIVTVTASNGTNSITQTITVNIANVNEAPSFTSTAVTSVTENSDYSYSLTASDPEGSIVSILATENTTLANWLSLKDSNTQVTTLAGSSRGYANGQGSAAKFHVPSNVIVDSNGTIYVAGRDRIRKIDSSGNVSSFVGSYRGYVNGQGSAARFQVISDVAIDSNGTLYVADSRNNSIRKVDSSGNVTTLAGNRNRGFANAQGTAAKFSNPSGVAVDDIGNVYVADTSNHRIRKIDSSGNVSTFAGSSQGNTDGQGTAAKFSYPRGITVDSNGNLYVADTGNNRIRKIDSSGNVSTFAGSSKGDADGKGTSAKFNYPRGITVDSSGNLYVADTDNNKIKKIDSSGNVSTLAGGSKGDTDGEGAAAKFYKPYGLAIDNNGTVYVADTFNYRIRKITQGSLKLQGTPAVSGVYDVNLTVTDGDLNATQNYQITVADVNDAPVLNSASFVVSENNATGSTVGTITATDEDGVNPSLALIGSAEVLTYSIVSGNTNSDFDINSSTGEITIAKQLNATTTQNYSLSVKAQDDGGASKTATVTITVGNEADTPVATADTTTLNEDNAVSFDILANDTDKDNNINKASLIVTQEPINGKVQIASTNNGFVTYTPDANYYGTDSFKYKVSDSTSLSSNEATVTIAIIAVNDTPVATNQTIDTDEDTNTTVLLNEYVKDEDEDNITYSIVSNSSNGAVTISDGVVDYSPTINFYGFDSFTYKANDGTVDSDTKTININVAEVNDIPIANNDYDNNTTEDNAITISVLTNDTDDGDLNVTSVIILNQAEHGTAVSNNDGTITYTPSANWYGNDSFEYTVKDDGLITAGLGSTGELISNPATVTINVSSVNDAPTAVDDSFTLDEDNVYLMNLHVNDTDVDGDLNGTAITIVTQPTHGEANVTSSGLVKYIPTKDYSGADSFTYKVSDGDVNSSSATVSLTINSLNDVPSILTTREHNISENSSAKIVTITAQDVENNTPFTYSKLSTKDGSFFTLTSDGNLSFTSARDFEIPADADSNNIYSVDVNITDSANGSFVKTFDINVTNAPLSITSSSSISVVENQTSVTTVTSDAEATDTYEIVAGNDGASFSIDTSSGALTFTSAPDFESKSSYTLTIKVTDSAGNVTATQAVTVNITNVNEAPTFTNAGATTATENSAYTYTPTVNDVDGNSTIVSAISLPSWLSLSSSTNVLSGTPTVSGVYDVNLSVSDGSLTTPQNYKITVADVNDAPILNDTAFVVSENNVTGSTVGTVTATDEDGVNPSLALIGSTEVITYSIVSGNTNSDFNISSTTGEITVAKELNAYTTSTYSLHVKAQDDDGASETATVTITISNEADTPVAVADSATIDEDNNATINLLSNDTDRDNNINVGSVVITTNPTYGSVDINGSGVATYVPNTNYHGSDYFTYNVSDNISLQSNDVNVTITINSINDTPDTNSTTFSTLEDVNMTKSLASYSSDVDGASDIASYHVASNPTNGSIIFIGTGFTYDPNLNFYGFDSFTFYVKDGNNTTSNTSTININVAEVNDIPIAYSDEANTTEDNSVNINVLVNDTDDEGLNSSSVAILNAPTHGTTTVEANGSITYTPNANWYGSDTFKYTVEDSGLQTGTQGAGVLISNAAKVTVNVSSVNDLPIAIADSFTLNEDSAYLMNLHVNDTDVDDTLVGTSITLVTQPTNGEANVTSTGLVRFIPTKDYSGADSFTYKISDGDVNSSTATVSLTINEVNDSPSFITTREHNVTENSTAKIVTLSAQDIENNTPFTYAIENTKDGSFFTVTSDGNLSFTSARNFESPTDVDSNNIYSVDVNITDSANGSFVKTFDIRVTDVYEYVAPPYTPPVYVEPTEPEEVEQEPETPVVDPLPETPENPVNEEEPETPVVDPLPETPENPVNEEEPVITGITTPVTNDDSNTKVSDKVTGVTTQAPQTSEDGTKTTIGMSDVNGQGTKKTEITTTKDVTKVVTSTESGTNVDLESTKTKSATTVNNNGTIDTKITNKDTGEEFDMKSSALGTNINVNEDGSFEMNVDNTDVVGRNVKVEDVDKDETISNSKTTLTSNGSTVEAKVVIKTTDPLTGEETTTTKSIDTKITKNTKVSITDDGSIQLKEDSINSVKVIDPNTNELADANVNSLLEIKPDGSTVHIVELTTDSGANIQTSATSNLAGSVTETIDGGLHTTATATTHVVENGETKEVKVDIEVTADNSGKATHSMSFTNNQGESTKTTATSDLVGASTVIDNNGKIETSIQFNQDNVVKDISVVANSDGSAEHVMKFKDATNGQSEEEVTTRATSKIVGAQTKIKTTGGVETTVNDKVGEFTIKAVVETDTDGNSVTKFEKYDSEGTLIETQKTTKSETLFEPGNKVIIENRDGKTVIDSTAKVSGLIEF